MALLTQIFKDGDFVAEGKLQPGGHYVYEVLGVEAALDLAKRFALTGRYKYFRGQKDSEWALESTFQRCREAGRVHANEEFRKFASFVMQSPELLPYLQGEDAIIAAAQHHGLFPTTFIDFTTDPEVAVWFATCEVKDEISGSIYLIDEAAETAISSFGEHRGTRIFNIIVPNLWRLQAQKGLFLEATMSIDHIWPLDRIVFRQDLRMPSIEKRHIFPERRSNLELAIEQYKLQRGRREAFQTFLDELDRSKTVIFDIDDDDGPVEGFVAPPAWSPDEHWDDIDVDSAPPRIDLAVLTSHNQLELLIVERRFCTDLLQVIMEDECKQEELQAHINRLWEGCRPFPYTSEQLTRALCALVATWQALQGVQVSNGHEQKAAAARILGDCTEIEMSTSGHNTARAFVSRDRLLAALTEETRQRIETENAATSATAILKALQPDYLRPAKNFDSNAFIDLFVDQVIPWQIATKRNPVAYSAFHVKTLGLP